MAYVVTSLVEHGGVSFTTDGKEIVLGPNGSETDSIEIFHLTSKILSLQSLGYVDVQNVGGPVIPPGSESNVFPILQFMDDLFLDSSITNVPAKTGSILTVVIALDQIVSKITVAEQTGFLMGLYENDILKLVIFPGMDEVSDVTMQKGSSVGVRSLTSNPITDGLLVLQFA